MSYANKTKLKTEHSGAKNGGGHRGKRDEAKLISRKLRRKNDKNEVSNYRDLSATDEMQMADDFANGKFVKKK